MPRSFFSYSLLFVITLVINGCFSISHQEQLLSSSGLIRTDDPLCTKQNNTPEIDAALDEAGFTLVSWNIFKENKNGWRQDLLALSNESDLILLQEAHLTQALSQFLETTGQNWEMISAFRYQGIHTGVMTMGHIPPQASCAQRTNEPIVRLPKSSLISYFPIRNTQQTLLVANIHAINFTPGIERFTEQLMEIKTVLAEHKGPIVFAGDFNTWSNQRQTVLNRIIGTGELNLNKVEFINSFPILFWGHRLDHVFFRGLRVVKAEAISVKSSDHYPLKVLFEFVPIEPKT